MKEKITNRINNLVFNNTQNQISTIKKTTFSGDIEVNGNLYAGSINNTTFKGPSIITAVNGDTYNLQTPTNGEMGYVLTTDGAGATMWSPGTAIGSGIIYSGDLPVPNGKHAIINKFGTAIIQSRIQEIGSNLSIDNLNITNCNEIHSSVVFTDTIRNISGLLIFDTDIVILGQAKTNKQVFTLDEFVSKKYVDDAIINNPITTTYQDIYDNSEPASTVLSNKNITFINNRGSVIASFIDAGAKFEAPNITSDGVTANAIISKNFQTTFINMDNSGYIDMYGTNLMFNAIEVVTKNNATFQYIYDNSVNSNINMEIGKDINFRYINDILKINTDSITAPIINTCQISSSDYFPPYSNNFDVWSFAAYNFEASASSFINNDHSAGKSYNINLAERGWISGNDKYDLTTGLPIGDTKTHVNNVFVYGEYLTLYTSNPISINGYYLGALISNESYNPVDFQLVGSVDGNIYQVIDTQTDQFLVNSGKQYVCAQTPPDYRYFRFIVKKIQTYNATGRCSIGSGTNFNIISIANQITLLGNSIQVTSDNFVSNNFIKYGGTRQQYLMADGSILQYSANSGNSNFYLYNNTGVTNPPPVNGQIGYNDAQIDATVIYLSHRTRDSIDIEFFYRALTQLQDVYIQDQDNSLNWIKYNITGSPTIIENSYVSIPVAYENGSGTGLTSFGNGHNLLVSFLTNSIEVDTRLTTLETKTQSQTNINGSTVFNSNIVLGSNNITGSGLIQGFNIPTLDVRLTAAQTTANNAVPKTNNDAITIGTVGNMRTNISPNTTTSPTSIIPLNTSVSNYKFPLSMFNKTTYNDGNITYTATASSSVNDSNLPPKAFTPLNNSNGWISGNGMYDATTGLATTAFSRTISGTVYNGAWILLQTSTSMSINSYYVPSTNSANTNILQNFYSWVLGGSVDGSTYTLIDTKINTLVPADSGVLTTFEPTSAYNYFLLVCTAVAPNNVDGRCALGAGTYFTAASFTPPNILAVGGDVFVSGLLTAGGNRFVSFGFNQILTTGFYCIPNAPAGATTSVSSASTKLFVPMDCVINSFTFNMTSLAGSGASVRIRVNGAISYTGTSLLNTTLSGFVKTSVIYVTAGSYIEMDVTGSDVAMGIGCFILCC